MPPKKKQAVGEEAPAPAAGVGAATKLDLARGDTISPSSETFSPLLEPESEANTAGAVALKPEKEQQPPAEKQKVRTEHPTGASRARADPARHCAARPRLAAEEPQAPAQVQGPPAPAEGPAARRWAAGVLGRAPHRAAAPG